MKIFREPVHGYSFLHFSTDGDCFQPIASRNSACCERSTFVTASFTQISQTRQVRPTASAAPAELELAAIGVPAARSLRSYRLLGQALVDQIA